MKFATTAVHCRRGATVIEMIVTTIILGTVAAISLPMLKLITYERRAATAHQQALVVASNVMERVSATPFENLATAAAEIQLPDWANEQLNEASLKVVVDAVPEEAARQVRLRLEWKSPRGLPVAPLQLTAWVYDREATP